MSRDPYPLLHKILKIHASKDILGVDLEDPKVWTRPPIADYRYLTVHWGGGPNRAGWPIEEPAMTFRQKVAVQIGRVSGVLKGWHAYHRSNGMSAIAYSTWVDSLFGRVGRLRGHRWNGGQWGSINGITHAVVLVMGFGQKASRLAWRSVGLIWFCSGAPAVVGHRFFNDWPQTKTATSCPGDENTRAIAEREYVKALGVLHRRPIPSRGKPVKACTAKLCQLLYLPRRYGTYRMAVRKAVVAFQTDHGLEPDGLVGPATWQRLAEA
jgi:hypothetical protein